MKTEEIYEETNDFVINSINEIINVQIIIDTDKLISDFETPSVDDESPIAIDHNYMYVVVSTPNETIGHESNINLKLSAEVGDIIRFNTISEYNNMDNSVLLCEVKKVKGANVFGRFKSKFFNKISIEAAIGESPLPPVFVKRAFWFYESSVKKIGKETFSLKFALYVRRRGQQDPILWGYYICNQVIVVRGLSAIHE
ncbi:inclusion body protein [Flavobacterium sp. 1]|uniref:AidA/PixA family protein n=1 Tax=Flavobacterium sp. 1 TaxID=2035200 RepID=UPI000C237C80|nr:AidA/PixA family protein [Flavobacterium sp. 1]PJJ07125.1 inclusion body protein [Flavobacterium sp. 1]